MGVYIYGGGREVEKRVRFCLLIGYYTIVDVKSLITLVEETF